MGKFIQPKIAVPNETVGLPPVLEDVSYYTEYSAVKNKPPISYDSASGTTKVNSKLHTNGDITTAGKVYNAVWNDYAELFLSGDESLSPGDIVVYDPVSRKVVKSSKPYDRLVVGVVSDSYGHILGGDSDKTLEENLEKYVPIGLAGRVKVKVSGDVSPGDLITTSSIPGVGVRVNTRSNDKEDYLLGTIIGKSLSYNINGIVEVLISLI